MSKKIRQSIVKSSKSIRVYLEQRMTELSLTPSAVVKDAKERGVKIDSASLSKYLHTPDSVGGLPEEAILFLALRWGIKVHLVVGTPTIVNNKMSISLPPYDEEEALKQVKAIFG